MALKRAREARPYIWLQDGEAEGRADCGCVLVHRGGSTTAMFYQCPLHAAAPKLLEYLKEAHQDEVTHRHYGDGRKGCSYCDVIAQAEGKEKK